MTGSLLFLHYRKVHLCQSGRARFLLSSRIQYPAACSVQKKEARGGSYPESGKMEGTRLPCLYYDIQIIQCSENKPIVTFLQI